MNRRSLLPFLGIAPAASAVALLPMAGPPPVAASAGHASLHGGMQLLAVTSDLDKRLQAMATHAATEALTRRVLAAEANVASLSGA